jgi:hypothetical protein
MSFSVMVVIEALSSPDEDAAILAASPIDA